MGGRLPEAGNASKETYERKDRWRHFRQRECSQPGLEKDLCRCKHLSGGEGITLSAVL